MRNTKNTTEAKKKESMMTNPMSAEINWDVYSSITAGSVDVIRLQSGSVLYRFSDGRIRFHWADGTVERVSPGTDRHLAFQDAFLTDAVEMYIYAEDAAAGATAPSLPSPGRPLVTSTTGSRARTS